ncbi:efflux RND transporter permease subunit [candidate division KSB1 bacterium]
MFITKLSVFRPVLMTMVILAFVVLGLFSVTDLAIDLMPEIDMPFVTVRTIYLGAGPEEVENLITRHIEEEVSAINGVKNITSTSIENVSIVAIEFVLGTDVDVAAADTKDKIELVKPKLPLDAEDPVIMKFDIGAQPVLSLAISSTRPLNELFDLTEDIIKPEFMKIPGLASIDILGGKEREIHVEIDQDRLKSMDLGIVDIFMGLSAENLNIPSGHITENRKEYLIRVSGEFETIDDIREIIIQTGNKMPVRLRDVARITDGFKEQRQLARFDGESAVGVSLIKRSDANVVAVSDRVKENLESIKELIPDDVEIHTASDNSIFIRQSIAEVVNNMGIGILLTALILFLFLHSWQGTVIAAVAMPTSIIATFILIRFAGFTINFMTLLGLAVTVGVLVTNSIVVLENIYRHREKNKDINDASIKGTTEIATAVSASTLTNIVVFTPIAFMGGIIGQFFYPFGLTVAFATLFSLLVSLTMTPMLASKLLKKKVKKTHKFDVFALSVFVFIIFAILLNIFQRGGAILAESFGTYYNTFSILLGIGIAGFIGKTLMGIPIETLNNSILFKIWRIFMKFLIVAVVGGFVFWLFLYLFNLTIAIILSSLIALIIFLQYSIKLLDKFAVIWDKFYDKLASDYRKSLDSALDHKGSVIMFIIAVFMVTMLLGQFVSSEFITQSDMGYINVSVELPPGSNFDQTNKTLLRIEEVLSEFPEIESYYSILGQAPGSFIGKNEGIQYGELTIKLVPLSERSEKTSEVLERLKMSLTKIPIADISLMEVESSGNDGGNPLQIEISGQDLEEMQVIADDVEKIAKATPGAVDIKSSWKEGVPEIQLIPNRKKLADYGISIMTLATVMRASIEGNIATQYRVANKEYDIRVMLNKSQLEFADQIKDLYIKKEGLYIPATELFTSVLKQGPTSISRKNKKRLIIVSGSFANRGGGDVVADIKEETDKLQLSPGYQIHFGGEAEIQDESFGELNKTLMLAAVLSFIVLAAILESYIFPFIILMTLPLAFIGIIISLIITGKTVSIVSMMAMVMLVGIVVNNGILLIDYMQNLREKGVKLRDAVLEASSTRLRPIIMTNLATAISMLPLALGLGEGSEMRSPMAVVSIGALITSTIFTLYVIPILYEVVESIKSKGETEVIDKVGAVSSE